MIPFHVYSVRFHCKWRNRELDWLPEISIVQNFSDNRPTGGSKGGGTNPAIALNRSVNHPIRFGSSWQRIFHGLMGIRQSIEHIMLIYV